MNTNYEFYTDKNGSNTFRTPSICKALMELRTPENGYDQVYFSLRIEDKIDFEKLEQSVRKVIEDNEALHLLVSDQNKDINVRLINNFEFKVRRENVPGNSTDEKIENVHEMVRKELMTEIPIFSDIPIKVIVYTLSEKDHIMLFSVDHLNFDGHSLVTAGSAFLRNYITPRILWKRSKPASLLQYYSECERYEKEHSADLVKYWNGIMEGYSPVELRPVTSIPDKTSDQLFHISLDKSLLEKKARSFKVSAFTLSIAAYYYAIYKVYGKKDIQVHYTSAGRNDKRYMETLGPFVKILPTRVNVEGCNNATDLIKMVSSAIYDANDHDAYIPYEITRSLSEGQFGVSYENYTESATIEKTLSKFNMSVFTPKVDTQYGILLALFVIYYQKTVEFNVHCSLRLWRAEDVEAIMKNIEYFLTEADLDNLIID